MKEQSVMNETIGPECCGRWALTARLLTAIDGDKIRGLQRAA
ncbi:hypothetical protein SB816_19435 [Achromobacter sp. SIMBA_011]|jgi:hypothetical protein|nr:MULTISPECIES: hypothetical protein [Achromobacter]MCZ8409173.1 hypothetical protein [Achromobacter dolens]